MTDFKLGDIFGLLRQTMPFLVFRFLIYIGITLAYVIGTAVGASVGYGIGLIGDNPGGFGAWGGIIGFGLVGVVVYMLREYLLYLVKAGHIAVLVELMDGKQPPQGRDQVSHAQHVVRERFGEASVLFGVDQLIKGILKTFNRVFFSIATVLPIPGLGGLANLVNKIINLSLTFLDEVILAYNIRTRTDNPWASSRTAIILYAQNYKAFLKNAVFLTFFIWGLTFLVFLIVLAPVAGLVTLFPGVAGGMTLIISLVFAWGIKQAVIEPIAMTALMQVYFKVTEGQEADPEWEARLEKLTGKFGELKDKALDWHNTNSASDTAKTETGVQNQPETPTT